jgi:hypothetical protein
MQNLHNIPNEETMPDMGELWTLGLITWMAGRPNYEIQAWIWPDDITLRYRDGYKYARWHSDFTSSAVRSWASYWHPSFGEEIDWSRITIENRKKKRKRA